MSSDPPPKSNDDKAHEENDEQVPQVEQAPPAGNPRPPTPPEFQDGRVSPPSFGSIDGDYLAEIDINPYGLCAESLQSSDSNPYIPQRDPPPLLQSSFDTRPTIERINFDTKFVFSPAQAQKIDPTILDNPDFIDPNFFERRQQTLQRMQAVSSCHVLKRSSNSASSVDSAGGSPKRSNQDRTPTSSPNLLTAAVTIIDRAREVDNSTEEGSASKYRKVGTEDADTLKSNNSAESAESAAVPGEKRQW